MFYRSRFSLNYTPDGGEELPLVRAGDVLPEEPEREWELSNEERNYLANEWGEDLPTGNARYKLRLAKLIERPSTAQVEVALRELELLLTGKRFGIAKLAEGYQFGVPGMVTEWQACITEVEAKLIYDPPAALNMAHAPATLKGKANAILRISLTLSKPQTIDN